MDSNRLKRLLGTTLSRGLAHVCVCINYEQAKRISLAIPSGNTNYILSLIDIGKLLGIAKERFMILFMI